MAALGAPHGAHGLQPKTRPGPDNPLALRAGVVGRRTVIVPVRRANSELGDAGGSWRLLHSHGVDAAEHVGQGGSICQNGPRIVARTGGLSAKPAHSKINGEAELIGASGAGETAKGISEALPEPRSEEATVGIDVPVVPYPEGDDLSEFSSDQPPQAHDLLSPRARALVGERVMLDWGETAYDPHTPG